MRTTLISLPAVACLIGVPQANAADATVKASPFTFATRAASWCIKEHGRLVSHDAGTVVCDQADVGKRAALYELLRGSDGPRKLRTTFQILPQGNDGALVQARRSYVFKNKLGIEQDNEITAAADEALLVTLLQVLGNSLDVTLDAAQ